MPTPILKIIVYEEEPGAAGLLVEVKSGERPWARYDYAGLSPRWAALCGLNAVNPAADIADVPAAIARQFTKHVETCECCGQVKA